MKNILLIGGSGYVGTVVAHRFLQKGYKISILDSFEYNNYFALRGLIGHPNVSIVKGDMVNKEDMSKIYSEEITDVILLAGLVGDPITKAYPDESKRINELGIRNCIDFFDDKKIEKLIFISTCSNYGLINENELADEEFELNPLSLYAKAKVNTEKYLLSKKNKVKYSATILRFATAFGISPRMRFDLSISEFVREIYFGNELLVYDEHTWRPYCHVRDFSTLLELVILHKDNTSYFEVFNAGGEKNNYTKKMIVKSILKQIPKGKVIYGKLGSDPRNYKVSFKKVKEIFGFEPKYNVNDGIKELINAFKLGLFNDSLMNKELYGNYKLNNDNDR